MSRNCFMSILLICSVIQSASFVTTKTEYNTQSSTLWSRSNDEDDYYQQAVAARQLILEALESRQKSSSVKNAPSIQVEERTKEQVRNNKAANDKKQTAAKNTKDDDDAKERAELIERLQAMQAKIANAMQADGFNNHAEMTTRQTDSATTKPKDNTSKTKPSNKPQTSAASKANTDKGDRLYLGVNAEVARSKIKKRKDDSWLGELIDQAESFFLGESRVIGATEITSAKK